MILIQLNPDNRTVILENREGGKLKKKEEGRKGAKAKKEVKQVGEGEQRRHA